MLPMQNLLFIIISLTLIVGTWFSRMLVEEKSNSSFGQVYKVNSPDTTPLTYAEVKSEILAIRSFVRNHPISDDSLSSLVTDLLVDRIIPYWIGTPWSFEGHTSIPNSGKIACGYFVSTTLLDLGFNLNRYTFAQQAPENE